MVSEGTTNDKESRERWRLVLAFMFIDLGLEEDFLVKSVCLI